MRWRRRRRGRERYREGMRKNMWEMVVCVCVRVCGFVKRGEENYEMIGRPRCECCETVE